MSKQQIGHAMGQILSKKQLEFLRSFESIPRYGEGLPVMRISNMPDDIWFTFRTETQAYGWVRRLADRGFVDIEKDLFARITESGIKAAKAAERRIREQT